MLRIRHKRLNESFDIDVSIGNIAVMSIAHEIVHFVGVERTTDEFGKLVS